MRFTFEAADHGDDAADTVKRAGLW